MGKGVLLALLSGLISAFSQVLLKKGSSIERSSVIKDYLNFYVISGYGLTVCCMLLMILAYRVLPFKYGAALESLVYLYIMLLSRLFFGETITKRKLMGNLLIVLGVAIFSL